MRTTKSQRGTAAAASVLLMGLVLSGCTSPEGSEVDGGGEEALDAALAEGGTLEYWSWLPSGEAQAEAFMAEHENVTINVRNTGGVSEHNMALQNAITAGTGVPDVIQVEYQSIAQYQLPGSLLDLTAYGLDGLEDTFTASTWQAVTPNDGVWALPQDSAPMSMFYNASVFDANGLEVPTTWEEFIAAGEALEASNPDLCIINDIGDAGFTTSMIWQAGGRPFKVEGDTVHIDLQDEGARLWADTWNELVEKGLNCEFPPGTNEWFQALNAGTIATLPAGPWMAAALPRLVPDGAGMWRVAPMPSYDGTPANAENGGSAQAVTSASSSPALAAAFLRWLSTDPASFAAYPGMFPSTVAELSNEEFLAQEVEYFGGQKINEVFADGVDAVGAGWQYLPWQVYANGIVSETVGQSYLNRTDINDGLAEWQERNVRYAQEQGFTVEE